MRCYPSLKEFLSYFINPVKRFFPIFYGFWELSCRHTSLGLRRRCRCMSEMPRSTTFLSVTWLRPSTSSRRRQGMPQARAQTMRRESSSQ